MKKDVDALEEELRKVKEELVETQKGLDQMIVERMRMYRQLRLICEQVDVSRNDLEDICVLKRNKS